jgi:hypothetical protein
VGDWQLLGSKVSVIGASIGGSHAWVWDLQVYSVTGTAKLQAYVDETGPT